MDSVLLVAPPGGAMCFVPQLYVLLRNMSLCNEKMIVWSKKWDSFSPAFSLAKIGIVFFDSFIILSSINEVDYWLYVSVCVFSYNGGGGFGGGGGGRR